MAENLVLVDYEFQVTGDSNLEKLRHSDEMQKVRMIEEEFQSLLPDVSDV